MFKKLSVAVVALPLIAMAQPALAQEVTKSGTIAFIAPATSTAPATMKIANDQYWVFIEAPAQPATNIYVNGKTAKVSDLQVGMPCGYTGTLPKAYLSKVSCQFASPAAVEQPVAPAPVAVAQPASAQTVSKTSIIGTVEAKLPPKQSTVFIDGQLWFFLEAPSQPLTTIYLNGKTASVKDLKQGMKCLYYGTLPKAYLQKISCSY